MSIEWNFICNLESITTHFGDECTTCNSLPHNLLSSSNVTLNNHISDTWQCISTICTNELLLFQLAEYFDSAVYFAIQCPSYEKYDDGNIENIINRDISCDPRSSFCPTTIAYFPPTRRRLRYDFLIPNTNDFFISIFSNKCCIVFVNCCLVVYFS